MQKFVVIEIVQDSSFIKNFSVYGKCIVVCTCVVFIILTLNINQQSKFLP